MARKNLNSGPSTTVALRIGRFIFRTDSATLFEGGRLVRIPRKSCELLGYLLENAGRVVTKDEIMGSVWADTFVEESNLSHHIAVLRKAFGADPEFIETVPRIGYRFVAPVTPLSVETAPGEIEFESETIALFGRNEEIAVLVGIVRDGCRLLTLTGPGGVGKTSLAREVMKDCAAHFPDGNVFIDLSETSDSTDVAGMIGEALGISSADLIRPFEGIVGNLRDRAMLLVLDNVEHLAAAAGDLAKLIENCPRLRIIVTSRVRLRIRPETEYRVSPLGVPGAAASFGEIASSPSVQLFADRARFARAGFALNDGNAVTLAQICRRLEGLPLAIELAAPRVKLMSPTAILDRLNHQLGLLSSSADGLPARQQTMRASIEWSVRLLTRSQQRLFAVLSVFHGSFGLDAVESVVSAGDIGGSLFDDLEALIDNGLLAAFEFKDEEVRFRFLQPILEFARSLAAQDADHEATRRAHAGHFLGLAAECEAQRRTIGSLTNEWGERIAAEDDNLREALRYLEGSGSDEALTLAVNLHLWWLRAGRFADARRLVESALSKLPDGDPGKRGYAFKAAAMIAWKQGDYATASEHYQRCLEIAQKIEDRGLQAIAVNGVGTVSYLTGNTEKAKSLLLGLLPESRRAGNRNLTESIIINLGEIARSEGDYETAVHYCRETLRNADPSDGLMLCGAYLNLGSALFSLGEIDEAVDCFERGGALAARLSLPAYLAVYHVGRAALAARNGDPEAARACLDEADRINREIGYEPELPDRLFRARFVDRLLADSHRTGKREGVTDA